MPEHYPPPFTLHDPEWTRLMLSLEGETDDQMIRRLDHEFQRKLHASGQFEPRAKV